MDQLKKVLDAHPNPASDAGEIALEAIYAAAECSLVCTACADACLAEGAGDHLIHCIRLDQDCAEICAITSRMLARPGHQDRGTLEETLEACIQACRACIEECGKHAAHMEHCAICADACRICVDACLAMRSALVA